MTKTKSQLRAEAVERLRDCRYDTLSDYVLAMLGWEHKTHFEGSRDALIDLLTDDPYEHITAKTLATALRDRDKWKAKAKKYADALEKLGCSALANGTVFAPSGNLDAQSRAEIEDAERSAKVEQDSRERLEAEIRYEYNGRIEWEADQIIEWLDRQAAITERHWMEICGANASANVELNRQNDELRLKVRRQGKQLAELQDAIRKRNEGVLKDSWKKQLAELKAERDMYRENLEAESNRTCTLAYDGKWLICSECGESLQWFGVRTIYKDGTQERALGVDGVKYCAFLRRENRGGRMSDMVNHPPHYTSGEIECIDAIQAALTPEEFRGYCKGNALKYVWRERRKGHGEDIRKAEWYLKRVMGE